ncbi:hypothetical protein ACFQ7A_22060, partial [Streptomyces sp. NPDC056528]
MRVRNEDVDPLALVLSDEPLPEGALSDPEVARALADVAVLREQLAVAGRVLAGQDGGGQVLTSDQRVIHQHAAQATGSRGYLQSIIH